MYTFIRHLFLLLVLITSNAVADEQQLPLSNKKNPFQSLKCKLRPPVAKIIFFAI